MWVLARYAVDRGALDADADVDKREILDLLAC
jgi:hypothetical protein